ncbi:alpha/beta hydrolase [Microbulbifer sp. VTAC004]|uniref:alpha/beta hydrolase n=1 Tax=Microbulbifer sp. VTAC004 TaxID=3243386 RepID=UPI0040390BF9
MKFRINLNILFAAIILCPALIACSQRIASLIESSESFPFTEIITTEKIEDLGFNKERYCPAKKDVCISYYYGPPLNKQKLQYAVKFEADGNESIVNLNLNRDSLEKTFSGTVFLLHGFRASKEFMLNSALYFRFLGFQVVVPDLLGHGDSSGNKKYGVDDSKYINSLIDKLIEEGVIKDEDIYIVGSSMGALTAAYISNMRVDISGAILLAPMLQFDQALYNYARVSHPLLSRIIPEKDIRKSATLALKKSNIDLNQTNILPLIKSSKVPVLLISSDSDRISPYSNYKGLNKKNLELIQVHNRNHLSMTTIGQNEHNAVIKWLNTNSAY